MLVDRTRLCSPMTDVPHAFIAPLCSALVSRLFRLEPLDHPEPESLATSTSLAVLGVLVFCECRLCDPILAEHTSPWSLHDAMQVTWYFLALSENGSQKRCNFSDNMVVRGGQITFPWWVRSSSWRTDYQAVPNVKVNSASIRNCGVSACIF